MTVVPEPTSAALIGLGLCGLVVACRRRTQARGSILLGFLVALSSAPADATVSLSLTASGDFTPGSVITLETRVTANEGEVDDAIFGKLHYPGDLVDGPLEDAGTMSQNSLPGVGWVGGTLTCTTARCSAFSQINTIGPTAIDVSDFLISINTFTIRLDALPGSVMNFTWQSTPSTLRLDFFGITSHPGVSITVIPEPTTAALLTLGLLALVRTSRLRGA